MRVHWDRQAQKSGSLYWILVFSLLFFSFFMERGGLLELVFMRLCIAGIMALGLYYSAVYAGLLSLGQGAFMAVGAYGMAVFLQRGIPVFPAMVFALILCGAVSFLVGYAVLELKGDTLSMATLALGEIVRAAVFNSRMLGGASGIYGLPLFLDGKGAAVCFLAVCMGLHWLTHTGFSARLRAVKNDEAAAESLGIPAKAHRMGAFVFSAVVSGTAGILFAGCGGFVTPFDFSFLRSMDTAAAVVLGGMGRPLGCLLAAFAIELSAVCLQSLSWVRMLFYGAGLIAAVWLLRGPKAEKGA